jgi:TPP-dependent pyruvate/acetoin dehydrogenase alpha subunit
MLKYEIKCFDTVGVSTMAVTGYHEALDKAVEIIHSNKGLTPTLLRVELWRLMGPTTRDLVAAIDRRGLSDLVTLPQREAA